jgi:hypothetical protein
MSYPLKRRKGSKMKNENKGEIIKERNNHDHEGGKA